MSEGKHLAKGSSKPVLPDDGILRLFSMRFCPYAHRVHLVLNAKKIPYHTVFINLTEKPEWLTDYSPLGKVPALQLPTEKESPSLIESLIIADYLDDKYPEVQLYSKDPLVKAHDRILVERFNAVIAGIYKVFIGDPKTVSLETLDPVFVALDLFEVELRERGTKFFGGANPGMLDYMIWPWCERFDLLKYLLEDDKYALDPKRFPSLITWQNAMLADPAVKGFYLDGATHAKFLKSRRSGTPNYDMLV